MNTRTIAVALAMSSLICTIPLSSCAVTRQQETVGQYIDDSTITTRVKARFAKDEAVAATSISVETMKGVVLLSGFAKNTEEKVRAEQLARGVDGVTGVNNAILIR